MRSLEEIKELLPLLESQIADDLEGQDLDFKQWDLASMNKSVSLVVKMAICFANGGGGTVVFGVADNVVGRSKAILGVPAEVDINLLKQTVYGKTDPKITPVFEELRVPEGHQRLIIMQIYPGMPPHTDTAGNGTIRVGKDCQPLTGTMRRKIGVITGESDYTAETIAGDVTSYLSHVGLEIVRNLARKENAPNSLLHLTDLDLLEKLDLTSGESVCVSFMHREFSPSFRAFVEKSNKNGRPLGVDELIILQYLLHHAEGETSHLALLCQRDETRIKDILSKMEQHELIERGGTGRGTYWTLKPKVHELLAAPGHPERDRRIDWEAAKTRVLSILMERFKRKENGITNKEIRQITHYNRQQVTRLVNQLRQEHPQIQIEGHGAGACYIWRGKA